jgi:hypothetical protein
MAKSNPVNDVLIGLYQRNNNTLNPEDVVEEASDDESPLHQYFEWDDTEAAHAYRLQQARGLIRRMTVRLILPDKREVVDHLFVSLTTNRRNEEGSYRLLVDVMKNEVEKETLLQQALRDLEAFQSKYQQLVELADVFAAIEVVAITVGESEL